jgi:arylformamidase
MIVNAGAHYVTLDFGAIREADGDLRVMAEQVRRAIAWVYKNADKFDGDRDRLYIGGTPQAGISAA